MGKIIKAGMVGALIAVMVGWIIPYMDIEIPISRKNKRMAKRYMRNMKCMMNNMFSKMDDMLG